MLSGEFHLIPIREISVPKDRQRSNLGDVEALAKSIRRVGLIHPITVTRDNVLVVGERRLRACELLLREERPIDDKGRIPSQYLDELDSTERKAVEYEENIRRLDLSWKEDCTAIWSYFHLRQGQDPYFNTDACGEAIGLSRTAISKRLTVAEALAKNDKQVTSCETLTAAYNIIERRRSRAVDAEVESLIRTGAPILTVEVNEDDEDNKEPDGSGSELELRSIGGALKKKYRPASLDVTCQDFREFASNYSGPRFNMLHCDFPYGVQMHKSDQAKHDTHNVYYDSKDTFFELLNALLENRDTLLAPSAHIMFWFSMNYYTEVKEGFEAAEMVVNPHPLVWYKEDKRGILPDAARGPRHVYETAFLVSWGDRKIIKSVPNLCVAEGVDKAEHYSNKPQLMLTQFFRMLVDESTTFLDPTCGSGSALSVAQFCGANTVQGMDIDSDCVELACRRLNATRLAASPPDWEAMKNDEV